VERAEGFGLCADLLAAGRQRALGKEILSQRRKI
jgi:hypothetical protein